MSVRRILVVSMLVALMAPGAWASWMGPGSFEPDTAFDREPGRAFVDPDASRGSGAGPVYFSGFATVEPLVVNPNVGLAGSRFDAPVVRYRAILGSWKDCNGDGYLGLAEGAVQDYRAELLTLAGTEVCPAGSPHNLDGWVHEDLMIGMTDPCETKPVAYQEAHCPGVGNFTRNPFVQYSEGAAVWADLGTPGAPPLAGCPLAPLPRGSSSSSGALLRVVDCRAGAVPPGAPDASAPVSTFGDPATGRAGLLQRESGRPMASAWDCSSSTDVADPTGMGKVSLRDPSGSSLSGPIGLPLGRRTVFADDDGDASTPGVLTFRFADGSGRVASVPGIAQPSTGSIDGSGSAWDAAVIVADGVALGASDNAPFVQRTTPGGPVVVAATNGDCDAKTYNTAQQAYVGDLVESDAAAVSTGPRDRSDVVLRFEDGYRGWDKHVDVLVGSTAPTDVGVLATRSVHNGPLWSALATTQSDPSPVSRDRAQPAGPRYVTFYADVGALRGTLVLPARGGGIYGREACQGATSGVQGDWRCDAAAWWRDAGGADVMPRFAEGAPMARSAGAAFDLRDVDCADGAVARGSGVVVGTAPLSPQGACQE